MKPKKIVAKDIKECHPFEKGYPSDTYYTRLANRLQDCFYDTPITVKVHVAEVFREAAIRLAKYMEDIVADSGPWRMFSTLCQQMFGHPVPMYHQQEEYYSDEPSLNAVRYLIWCTVTEITDEIAIADSEAIEWMAQAAYQVLDECFDEAPVCEQLAEDISELVEIATEGFDGLRAALSWLYTNCYVTVGDNNFDLMQEHLDSALEMLEKDIPMTPGKAVYYATTQCLFAYRIGPLALYPKDYLAALMRIKGMDAEAKDVEQVDRINTGTYRYEFVSPSRLLLTRTNGRQIEIEADELNLDEKRLHEYNTCMPSSFVWYQGEWHLNGILFPYTTDMEKWDKMCADDPDNLKPGTKTMTAEMLLERTGGRQMLYFADNEEMKDFLRETLKFPRHLLTFVDEQPGELPAIFIDTEEPKNCMHTFIAHSAYIADPSNPYYNAEKAKDSAIDILWNGENMSTHAVNYLLNRGYLPDIFADPALSKHSTDQQKRQDIDFLMRFWRRENY